jgi:hypothetical protein
MVVNEHTDARTRFDDSTSVESCSRHPPALAGSTTCSPDSDLNVSAYHRAESHDGTYLNKPGVNVRWMTRRALVHYAVNDVASVFDVA